MTISLAKSANATPDFYSQGDGTDPISAVIVLDGTGNTVTSSTESDIFVWANDLNSANASEVALYSNVNISISGSDSGVVWELSTTGSGGWANTISISDIDVSSSYQATQIYARATADNDGSVATANYTTADIVISALEEPA